MRILFICDEYPPGMHGGIGTSVQVLGRELAKQGHRVYVCGLYSYAYGQQTYEEDHGIKIWRLRYGPNLGNQNNILYKVFNKLPRVIRRHLNGKRAFANYLDFIRLLIKKENIEIIEIADWNTFAMNIGFVVKWPEFKIPFIVKSHGSYTKIMNDLAKRPKPHLAMIDSLLYKRADALSAVSKHAGLINKKLFSPSKEIKVLYNGIGLYARHIEEKRENKKIIYSGTLSPQKGIYQLAKAWNEVHKKHPDAKLYVYGKGKTAPLKRIITNDALLSVSFQGHVKRNVLFKELSTATMAIFPSYTESFSFAPLEAMIVGCPVINTSRSSGKELVTDYENGSLVDPDDIIGMAEKIMELLTDKKLQEKYSKNGRKTVRNHFNITKSAHDHVEYYQEVINTYSKQKPYE